MILYHTWSANGEVALDAIKCRRFLNRGAKYAELQKLCRLANREGCHYA